MVKNNKKQAFSIAESIMSMMIIMIAALCLAPVLTKQKASSGLNEVSIKGSFGCYYDQTGVLKSFLCRERNCDDLVVTGRSCTLSLTKRPEKYFIIAAGAGGDYSGQVKTWYTPEFSDNITTTPGVAGSSFDDGVSVIDYSSDSSNTLYAIPYKPIALNGLIPENISKCKIAPNSASAQKKCEIKSNNRDYAYIFLEGYASPIMLNSLSKVSRNEYNYGSLKFNFDFKDSSLHNGNSTSHMSEILSNMYALRQNDCINKVIEANPGAPNKNGGIVILW